MTVYYVAKSGNDSNAGTSQSAPKLTLGGASGACAAANSDGDIVEIIDEGTYSENDIGIQADNVTVRHTASHLGRPKIDGGGNTGCFVNAFTGTGFKLQGLEIFNYVGSYPTFGRIISNPSNTVGCEITDCFIYKTDTLFSTAPNGTSGSPNKLERSIFMFRKVSSNYQHIRTEGHMEIVNCLLSSSTSTAHLLEGYSSAHTTASFCTIINNGTFSGDIINRWGRVTNCIVTGSGNGMEAATHTHNLVNVAGDDFTGTNSSAGTGDVVDTDPEFVDGSAIGHSVAVYESFKLSSVDSPAVGTADGTFRDKDGNLITTDLAGITRPLGGSYDKGAYEFEQVWSDYTPDRERKWGSDLTINATQNSLDGRKYALSTNNRQAPYSQTIRGVPSIRLRSTPAKSEK